MSAPDQFATEDSGTLDVEVIFMRGICDGREGFWCIQRTNQGDYSSQSFVTNTKADADAARFVVFAFNDTTCVGISGKDAPVKTLHQDNDSASYLVTARLTRIVRKVGAA